MDDIAVLITGVGAPGVKGTIFSLVNNSDNRRIKIVGTDIMTGVIGQFLCDKFYQIAKPATSEYLMELLSICEKESIDVILPQNTLELSILAKHKDEFNELGSNIAISSSSAIDISNNKFKLLSLAKEIGVPTTDFYLVDNFENLVNCAEKLGWPNEQIIIKPPISNGMRGLRVINESVNIKELFYTEKPNNINITMDGLRSILGDYFPSLLVMDYLPKDEYTVDILNADLITVIPRKRDLIRSGITFNGTTEENYDIIKYSKKLTQKTGLEYAHGFQFKLDDNGIPRLLESNPRIQGTMVLSTLAGANIIYGAVKHALNEFVGEFDIKWGTRLIRYWGGIGVYGKNIIGPI